MIIKIETLDIVYKILACVVSLITILGVISRLMFPRTKRYLSNYDKFTDRYHQTLILVKMIKDGKKVINVYGKKGVGKSYYLKYFSDFINGKISNKYSRIKKLNKEFNFFQRIQTKVIYYEINEYVKDTDLAQDFIENTSNKNIKYIDEYIEKLLKISIHCKKIIIIFDNVTNECIENSVENLIIRLQPISHKLVFILGSIEELTLPKLGNDKPKIEIQGFGSKEIDEYAKSCNKKLPSTTIKNIYDISNGLPIMIDLMISNDDYSNKDYYNKYIDKLFNNMEKEDCRLAKTAIYIALLSLVNSEVSISTLNNFDEKLIFNKSLLKRLHMFAIIKYNVDKKTIKMHDIVRDYLVYEIAKHNYYEDVKNIYLFYLNNNDLHNSSVYLILLKNKDIEQNKQLLIQCINSSIEQENYMYLISLGNHFFQNAHNPQKDELYYAIAHGYILSLLSVGDYPSAKKFSDEESLTVLDTINNNHISVSIQISDLYHLQSCYDISIELYNMILSKLADDEIDKKNIISCQFKKAHSFRHMGCYEEAINCYFQALKLAEETNNQNTIATINLELSVIYLSKPSLLQTDYRYTSLEELFSDTFNIVQKTNNETNKLLFYRNYSRFLISSSNEFNPPEEAKEKLELALKGYENLKKRLIYTMNFEFGEYYRCTHNHTQALSYYKKAIYFSKKNGDKNLETMSYLGIVLCEMDAKKFMFNKSKKEQIELLIKTIGVAEKYNLFINRLLAQTLLNVLQNDLIENDALQLLSKSGLEKTAEVLNNSYLDYSKLQLFMM